MTRDPVNNRLTDWQIQMLARIFRIILKEITCEDDIKDLAPGEMGIDYRDGSLYVRNPHNGKIFSPNNITFIKSILNKFDPKLDILNADRVANITFYSRLGELDKLPIEYTPDTVIRQMHAPAVLFSDIQYENYKELGWPSNRGMCLVYKTDEEHVMIRYYDSRTYLTYEGRYNQYKHLFEGWAIAGGCMDSTFDETHGGGDTTSIYINKELRDLMVVTVRVTETLNPGATISVDHREPQPIVMQNGEPLSHEIAADNIIMLIYDEPNMSWILVESTESAVLVTLSIVNNRMNQFHDEFNKFRDDTDMRFISLGNYIDEGFRQVNNSIGTLRNECVQSFQQIRQDLAKTADELATKIENSVKTLESEMTKKIEDTREKFQNEVKRLDSLAKDKLIGITATVYNYTATEDGITAIETIDDFDGSVDQLVVNYGQTLLRIGIDYTIKDNGIVLTNDVAISAGDIIQFIIIKQKKSE